MSQGMVDKVVVGADRIVSDAVLNKIGTYNVAVLAFEHGIPFYVAAPMSTMDQSRSSKKPRRGYEYRLRKNCTRWHQGSESRF